jgi:hypothetical protein
MSGPGGADPGGYPYRPDADASGYGRRPDAGQAHYAASGYGDRDPDRASDPDRGELVTPEALLAPDPEPPGIGPDDLETLLSLTRRDASELHQIEPGPHLGTDTIEYHVDANAVPDRPAPAAQPAAATPAATAAAPARRRTNTLAMIAVCTGVLFPPAGIVVGHLARKQIRQTREDGEGLAMAGIVLGSALTIALLVGCCGLSTFDLFSHGLGH